MKKFLVIVLIVAMAGVFSACNKGSGDDHSGKSVGDGEPVILEFVNQEITDKKLKELVESGEIPADIEVLNLTSNHISDISPLAGLTHLESLMLVNNKINELSPLADLTKLKVLGLTLNKVHDVSPLTGLTDLEWLSLVENPIKDLSSLYSLVNLKELYLGYISLDESQITELKTALPGCEIFTQPGEQE